MELFLLLFFDEFLVEQFGDPLLADGVDFSRVSFPHLCGVGAGDGFEGDLHLAGFGGQYRIDAVVLLPDGHVQKFMDVIVLEVYEILVAIGQSSLPLLIHLLPVTANHAFLAVSLLHADPLFGALVDLQQSHEHCIQKSMLVADFTFCLDRRAITRTLLDLKLTPPTH